jgi:hypothetical protein
VLLSPIIHCDFSPENFRSCGIKPIVAKGKIVLFLPIEVSPSITTWLFITVPSPIFTLAPMTQKHQFQHFEQFALRHL